MLGYVSVHGKNYHFLKRLYYILLPFLPVHSNWMEPGVNNPGGGGGGLISCLFTVHLQ